MCSYHITDFDFIKGHGLGNDFILFDQRAYNIPEEVLPLLARTLCRRRFYVGADEMLLVCDPTTPDYDIQFRIFNDDGSEAEMSGNGICFFAKYIYESKIVPQAKINVETKRGLVVPELTLEEDRVKSVRVDLGAPIMDPVKIPVMASEPVIDQPILLEDREFRYTAVSMGNPHAVIFTDDIHLSTVKRYGAILECKTELFPKKTNVEFVRFISDTEADFRAFERGVGYINASGTGAAAAGVAGVKLGLFQIGQPITFHMMEGDLSITVMEETVVLDGPATEVYSGHIKDLEIE